MRIIPATEPIEVEHPIFLIISKPGLGKSTLGYSMRDPLLLDFDGGAHRAKNRRSTAKIDTWKDVGEVETNPKILDPYGSLICDTVGRGLDLMTIDLIETDAKNSRGGGELSIQGWGRLKSRWRAWMNMVRAQGKDILLLSHEKEEKKGDDLIIRADIQGGSYAEVMKMADFVGYLYLHGNQRILDFSPTQERIGKNPGGWPPFEVPPYEKATEFMAKLYAKGREALGAISNESAVVMQEVELWRERIAALDADPRAFNAAIPTIKALPMLVQSQAAKLLVDRATALGWKVENKLFVAPLPQPSLVETGASGQVDPALGI